MTKRKTPKPDEVFSLGPLKAARFGKVVELTNTATADEMTEIKKRTAKVFNDTEIELEKAVLELQSEISKYSALDVMNYAVYELINLFMQKRIESDYEENEPFFVATVEYIQYLIARTPVSKIVESLTDEKWKDLWQKALKVMELMSSWIMTRPPQNNPPTEMDMLRVQVDYQRLLVRHKRHQYFFEQGIRHDLLPFSSLVVEAFGVTVDQIADGIRKIERHLSHGIGEKYRKLGEAQRKIIDKLIERGYDVSKNSAERLIQIHELIDSEDSLREEFSDYLIQARSVYEVELFDITDVSGLPEGVLDVLSVSPGEAVLMSLTGPNHDDLSPLSPSTMHKRPLLKVDGRYYTFYHSGLDDKIADLLESYLYATFPGRQGDVEKMRSDAAEDIALVQLSSVINPELHHANVYYPNPDEAGGLTELDGIMAADDVLFLIEVKSGGLNAGAQRGAPKGLADAFKGLIFEGQRQSERAERYLRSKDSVEFYDETGKNTVCSIRHEDYRQIVRIVVTHEDMGWVGAKLAQLSVLDPSLSTTLPWHISINDLRVVADLFIGKPAQFLHYIEQRLQAGKVEGLSQNDELDHIGIYNSLNMYQLDLNLSRYDKFNYDSSFTSEIDEYYADKFSGKDVAPPSQILPRRIGLIVEALNSSNLSGRFHIAFLLLSYSGLGRRHTELLLERFERSIDAKRNAHALVPVVEMKTGITFITGTDYVKARLRSILEMRDRDCQEWYIVTVGDSFGAINKIEKIITQDVSPEEIEHAEQAGKSNTETKFNRHLPKNAKCPCGSGKKFRNCHRKELI